MRKYYTRACNFYHGRAAASLIKSNKAFPLNGKKDIAFDKIEIFTRDKRKIKNKLIHKIFLGLPINITLLKNKIWLLKH